MRSLMLAFAVAAMMTAPALAQQSNQQAPQYMMHQGMMGHGMMGHGMMGMMHPTQHVEGRLAFLKTELKITDAQAPQWKTYADAFRANTQRMNDLMADMMPGGMMMNQGMMGQGMMGQGTMNQGMMNQGRPGPLMTVPERFDRAEKHMAAHLEMLSALKGPTLDLYGVLSDEQKHVADELLMGPMGMM
ncbi:Spy/CpxP family protein refolding chaperone [Dongia sp.]|uniref:Spy/CpxP family protein refolding chaperone n=1 Tax=Dongia sp. TaxID=1977262 RepID=UPI0035B249B1